MNTFKHTSGDIIVTIDSDCQHNPEEISKLIKLIFNDQADIIVGSRYLGKSDYRIPLHTRIGEYYIKISIIILFNPGKKSILLLLVISRYSRL